MNIEMSDIKSLDSNINKKIKNNNKILHSINNIRDN